MIARIKHLLVVEDKYQELEVKYKKLKKDYYELQTQVKEQPPLNEIKICSECQGYLLRLGKNYIHISRGNCSISDGTAVEVVEIDSQLQQMLKAKVGPLTDLSALPGQV